MNEHFHKCSFLGCGNLVARHRKTMFCYAVHIFLGGMDGPTDWRTHLAKSVSSRSPKTVKFHKSAKDESKDFDEFTDYLATEVCADWRVYYIGDPNQRDTHQSACFEAGASANKSPKKTIVIFETMDLPHEDNVYNLRAYYDWLGRFPKAHICSSVTDAVSILRESIRS